MTAEHLESAFYAQGFATFPDEEFRLLGLNDQSIESLKQVGRTEATHVEFLLGAIAGAGFKPVQACEYAFNFDTAANMVQTARVLEAIGVSAYLGAAPLITDPAILGAAAGIATIEARHQSFIRVAQATEAIPAAFDTPLGPRAVFTLAAPFIASCPEGSLLNLSPFPSIQLDNAAGALPGARINLLDQAQPEGAAFCAYLTAGGQKFSPLENGSCEVPLTVAGESYLMITSEQSIVDEAILAG